MSHFADEPDDLSSSAAFAEFGEQLAFYTEAQGSQVEALRARLMPNHPWPDQDNPMLAYLIRRAAEQCDGEPPIGAIAWLAAHAWFEGVLEERARTLRHLSA